MIGHKAADCLKRHTTHSITSKIVQTNQCVSAETLEKQLALCSTKMNQVIRWSLDGGATSHISSSICNFVKTEIPDHMESNLGNNTSTTVIAKGQILFNANVFG